MSQLMFILKLVNMLKLGKYAGNIVKIGRDNFPSKLRQKNDVHGGVRQTNIIMVKLDKQHSFMQTLDITINFPFGTLG